MPGVPGALGPPGTAGASAMVLVLDSSWAGHWPRLADGLALGGRGTHGKGGHQGMTAVRGRAAAAPFNVTSPCLLPCCWAGAARAVLQVRPALA